MPIWVPCRIGESRIEIEYIDPAPEDPDHDLPMPIVSVRIVTGGRRVRARVARQAGRALQEVLDRLEAADVLLPVSALGAVRTVQDIAQISLREE